jgi:hypothetical protein
MLCKWSIKPSATAGGGTVAVPLLIGDLYPLWRADRCFNLKEISLVMFHGGAEIYVVSSPAVSSFGLGQPFYSV